MIALLKSPLALAGVVALLVVIAAYQAGARGERARGEAATLKTELATAKAELASAIASAESDAAKAAELQALANHLETQLDATQDQLNALPADQRPRAGRDALDRLYGR